MVASVTASVADDNPFLVGMLRINHAGWSFSKAAASDTHCPAYCRLRRPTDRSGLVCVFYTRVHRMSSSVD